MNGSHPKRIEAAASRPGPLDATSNTPTAVGVNERAGRAGPAASRAFCPKPPFGYLEAGSLSYHDPGRSNPLSRWTLMVSAVEDFWPDSTTAAPLSQLSMTVRLGICFTGRADAAGRRAGPSPRGRLHWPGETSSSVWRAPPRRMTSPFFAMFASAEVCP